MITMDPWESPSPCGFLASCLLSGPVEMSHDLPLSPRQKRAGLQRRAQMALSTFERDLAGGVDDNRSL